MLVGASNLSKKIRLTRKIYQTRSTAINRIEKDKIKNIFNGSKKGKFKCICYIF